MTSEFTASIEVGAPPAHVFAYFTDPAAIVQWMGDYAVLDARPGGEFTLDIGGIPIRGNYVEVVEPERIVVSWGHAGSKTIPPGSTEVTFSFAEIATGTEVTVVHRGLPDEHVPSHQVGWPMFLDNLASALASGSTPTG